LIYFYYNIIYLVKFMSFDSKRVEGQSNSHQYTSSPKILGALAVITIVAFIALGLAAPGALIISNIISSSAILGYGLAVAGGFILALDALGAMIWGCFKFCKSKEPPTHTYRPSQQDYIPPEEPRGRITLQRESSPYSFVPTTSYTPLIDDSQAQGVYGYDPDPTSYTPQYAPVHPETSGLYTGQAQEVYGVDKQTGALKTGEIVTTQDNSYVAFYKDLNNSGFGNFHRCHIKAFGKEFECAEAAFQYRKCQLAGLPESALKKFYASKDTQGRVNRGYDGEGAFQASRRIEREYDKRNGGNAFKNKLMSIDWKKAGRAKCDEVMWEVLQCKFGQNAHLMKSLRDTGNALILEHNQEARENWWSDNHDGSGKNMLGKMLEAIRKGSISGQPATCPSNINSQIEQQRIRNAGAHFEENKVDQLAPIWT